MTRVPPTDPHLRLLDDARQAQAVADRSQRRLLQEADEQDATFLGSLQDAAEAGGQVVLETTVGRRVRGTVRALAADHVVVDGEHGTAWVRLSAVTVLRGPSPAGGRGARGGVRAGGGERPDRPDVPFARALRSAVEHRPTVEVVFAGGASTRGVAVGAGRDVLTLQDRATGGRSLLHLTAVALVVAPHD